MLEGDKVYFDTMLYLNKFWDPMAIKPSTINMFRKVRRGEFRLVVSHLNLLEMYHVMCLPVEKTTTLQEAKDVHGKIIDGYADARQAML